MVINQSDGSETTLDVDNDSHPDYPPIFPRGTGIKTGDEGHMPPDYDVVQVLARAYALKQPYEEVTKYLDAPMFEKGDFLYIDNLIAAIEAPLGAPDIIPNGGGT